MKKINVIVLFGGTNTEHEVSLASAAGIINNLNPSKYKIIPVKITKDNRWVASKSLPSSPHLITGKQLNNGDMSLTTIDNLIEESKPEVVFPVLHGPYGEDGSIQGLLELMRIPYVGCGITSSAICMDKVIQKKICERAGIDIAPYHYFSRSEWAKNRDVIVNQIIDKFSPPYPLFVKPSKQGSSVGVSKAHNKKELVDGIDLAFSRDHTVIVEKAVANAREIECSVLGTTSDPYASVLGEITPGNEFYDYEAKYESDTSRSLIPAKLPPSLTSTIQACAINAFKELGCYGLARVDFLLDGKTNEFYLNELNTMPGFTPISMYPKLWEASGLSYTELLDKLIDLAIERHKEDSNLNLSR